MPASPNLVPLEQAQRPFFLGVDVGGTNIKIGLVDDLGRTLASTSLPTEQEHGPQFAIQRTTKCGQKMLADLGLSRGDVLALGLGTPGTMDIPAGMLLEPPNLPAWSNFPIRDALGAACGLPVTFANDAGAAAFGEFWVGSGKEYHSIVLLTLGTGVGGGIIIGDLSIDGENSHGAECGHMIIDSRPDARRCSCGQLGHLEAYASATALIKRAAEAITAGRQSSLQAALAAGQDLTGRLIAEAAEARDELALELILETADYLSVGIVSLMNIVDPAAVILGGAMNFGGHGTPLGRRFLDRVQTEVRKKSFPVLAKRTVIDFALLGGDAGYIGAAGLARLAQRRQKIV